ncbi:MAG: 50S ribosomal protein L21 [Alphaproteobacteria bacterium]|nr:50S ribosomal protein L21 [Alphaproteobacteria bacterium]
MYAVVRTGGKQYRVARDDVIRVERLGGAVGSTVELANVLMVGDGARTEIGAPAVSAAKVVAEIVEQTRDAKLLVFKKKRRKNHRRLRGHRQQLTVLRITDILPDGDATAAAAETEAPAVAEAEAEAEPGAG